MKSSQRAGKYMQNLTRWRTILSLMIMWRRIISLDIKFYDMKYLRKPR